MRRIEDFQALDLKGMLRALLPWPLPLELERMAPERWAVPSGSSVTIDYSQDPPVLAVKLQEMFGCEETPTIADGRVALLIHLLSPGQHPAADYPGPRRVLAHQLPGREARNERALSQASLAG